MSRAWAFLAFVFLLFTLAHCTPDSKTPTLHKAVVDYVIAITPRTP